VQASKHARALSHSFALAHPPWLLWGWFHHHHHISILFHPSIFALARTHAALDWSSAPRLPAGREPCWYCGQWPVSHFRGTAALRTHLHFFWVCVLLCILVDTQLGLVFVQITHAQHANHILVPARVCLACALPRRRSEFASALASV
jgi:hypothetical protein